MAAALHLVGVPWWAVAKNLVLPHLSLDGGYLTVVVAVFGTTISPYLFFWQAGEEVENEKEDPTAKPLIRAPEQAPVEMARMQIDTLVGMGLSNIIALFIMLKTAATLNAHGVTDIQPRNGSLRFHVRSRIAHFVGHDARFPSAFASPAG
jgi:Mn2+/Fe2+ NRAMP family transporter